MAGHDRLGHAYLLVGPPSVGKTALALDLAGMLVCTGPQPRPFDTVRSVDTFFLPCGTCRACHNLARGAHPDVRLVERAADRRDITIDQVRQIEEEIGMAPYEAARKLFCLCGADSLNAAAASALLKTLEEPPGHAVLVLAASDPMTLPSTVRSRCQQLILQPVSARAIAAGLIEAHGVEPGRARELAVLARGRPGWAVRALSETSLAEQERANVATVAGLTDAGAFTRLMALDAWLGKGHSFVENRERALALLSLLESHWRDALLQAQGGPGSPLFDHLVGEAPAMRHGTAEIVSFVLRIQETASRVEANVSPRLALEHLLAAMPQARSTAHAAR